MEFSAKPGRMESNHSDCPTSRGNSGKGSVQKDYEMDSIYYNRGIIRPVVALVKSFASVRTAADPCGPALLQMDHFKTQSNLQEKSRFKLGKISFPKPGAERFVVKISPIALFSVHDFQDCIIVVWKLC
jgi:hypothetical protein